jgi:hypothetical protein
MVGNVLGNFARGMVMGAAVGAGVSAIAHSCDRVTLGCGYPAGPCYGPYPQLMPRPVPVFYPQPVPVMMPRPMFVGGCGRRWF